MRIYLDNCSFNRPYDDQSYIATRLETEAKLQIQNWVRNGEMELVWSYMSEYENDQNPYNERRERIGAWREIAAVVVPPKPEIVTRAAEYMRLGLREKDATHIACAAFAGAEYFITTDKKVLNKPIKEIILINPIGFVRRSYDVD